MNVTGWQGRVGKGTGGTPAVLVWQPAREKPAIWLLRALVLQWEE